MLELKKKLQTVGKSHLNLWYSSHCSRITTDVKLGYEYTEVGFKESQLPQTNQGLKMFSFLWNCWIPWHSPYLNSWWEVLLVHMTAFVVPRVRWSTKHETPPEVCTCPSPCSVPGVSVHGAGPSQRSARRVYTVINIMVGKSGKDILCGVKRKTPAQN